MGHGEAPGRSGAQEQPRQRNPDAHSAACRPDRQPQASSPQRWPAAVFDKAICKQRNTGERCFNRLKQWRGLAMRTDKFAIAYQAALHHAAIPIWSRS